MAMLTCVAMSGLAGLVMHFRLSVRTCNSKTIAPIDLIFLPEDALYPWLGPTLR